MPKIEIELDEKLLGEPESFMDWEYFDVVYDHRPWKESKDWLLNSDENFFERRHRFWLVTKDETYLYVYLSNQKTDRFQVYAFQYDEDDLHEIEEFRKKCLSRLVTVWEIMK